MHIKFYFFGLNPDSTFYKNTLKEKRHLDLSKCRFSQVYFL